MHKLGDYDIWYKVCDHCGYDTAKSTARSRPNCWKCGRKVQRDYSDRALKSNATITAIEDDFVTLECDGGDSVTIYNSGYSNWWLKS